MSNENIFNMTSSSSKCLNLCDWCIHKDVCKYNNRDLINGRGVYMEVYTCPFRKVYDDKLEKIRKDYEIIEERLRHLLQSDFISRFDEKNIYTGEYIRDINDIDKLFYGDGNKEEN